MLDEVIVFRKTGVVLWSHAWVVVKGSPVNQLIHQVLLEERMGSLSEFADSTYTLKWLLDNELDLVFVAIQQKHLSLPYVEELLVHLKHAFLQVARARSPTELDAMYPCAAFTPTFLRIHAEVEKRALAERVTLKKQRSFAESKKFQNTRQGQKESATVGYAEKREAMEAEVAKEQQQAVAATAAELTDEQIAANRAKLARGGSAKKGKKDKPTGDDEVGAARKGKEARNWDGNGAKEPGKKEKLDFSKKEDGRRAAVFQGTGKLDLDAEFGDLDEEPSAASGSTEKAPSQEKGMLARFSNLVGGKTLERSDIEPLANKILDQLVSKNVAQDIGEAIIESITASLEHKQLSSFASLNGIVRTAMQQALTRILTPTKRVDLLADVASAKAEKRPYVIVFVGVNGVGKSTSLSKVAYYLRTNGFTPMLCACDTFRAGAVEQLRVHAQALELPLFEKGYGRDASGIASDGIIYAKQMGYDVVMVDTAGRMQDNEPLMRALSKLVNLNQPDLVLFVGEALAGNDAVDQVRGFNRSLSEFAAGRAPRLIDGIMLTKFDTINDKVGAALSLVYTTGKPIVFCGVGQTYADIRNLNVEHVVKSLLR
ncbi:hypothetical protein AB1Y20_015725 [Prymnesium parvum]|uniref:SRP54-type proteins GTP-binding domain-containing protein n=1 Tax=Prymnesium parvum TaxID=97485 RepID=A0AB34JXK5_PRYPA|mmetsp:Transcript_28751/g.71652  ORF Transcript_28751/g.71652 Transcript_28751/m.71652 type:complete len:599 (+) Transcript_28751:60-1856(+)